MEDSATYAGLSPTRRTCRLAPTGLAYRTTINEFTGRS